MVAIFKPYFWPFFIKIDNNKIYNVYEFFKFLNIQTDLFNIKYNDY